MATELQGNYSFSELEAAIGNAKTAADLKTAYESNSNTNAYTDAEKTKLAGIEEGADVTDATNVAAAGAVMTDSDATLDSLQLNGGTGTQGKIGWDVDEEMPYIILNGTTVYIPQDGAWNVRNNSGSTIAKGTPVMATGTIGASGRITIAPMDGTDSANAKLYLGFLSETLANDSDGKEQFIGKMRGITTDGSNYGETWIDGNVIYISTSTAGALTNVAPTSGLKMAVAFVIKSHATNGTLAVRTNNLDENRLLTDAQITLINSALQNGDNVSSLTNDAGYLTSSSTITDYISGLIEAPSDKDYKLVVKSPYACTITETTTISTAGTATATFKINTTALGGTANSVSSTEESQTHSSSNSVSAGDDIVLTISSTSSCENLSFTIKFTRSLA